LIDGGGGAIVTRRIGATGASRAIIR
jgi:hypothetical protein